MRLMPYTSPSHSSSSNGVGDEKTRPWMADQYAPGALSVSMVIVRNEVVLTLGLLDYWVIRSRK